MSSDAPDAIGRRRAATVRVCSEIVLPRRISLPSGGVLEVRPVRAGDVAGLRALVEGLDDEDRYRRFFSLSHPDAGFYERLTAVDERGGACLVVVDVGGSGRDVGATSGDVGATSGDDGRIVAEASYELLDNGNGEMAITVAREWRGWLGPYLLGVLCAVAAQHGIPNLEAVILPRNRQMRALSRHRGEVYLPGSDWKTVRVEFPTSGPTPVWTTVDRPRVLLEMRSSPWEALADLASSGYEVVACPGPERRSSPCPLLEGRECPLAAGADAIIIALPEDDDVDELLRAHAARHGTVPVEVIDRGAARRTIAEQVGEILSRSSEPAPDGRPEP